MSDFIPSQIVCLDVLDYSLSCQVIDNISKGKKLWLRPQFLVKFKVSDAQKSIAEAIDLRLTADLLWQKEQVRIVYDMEYLNFYSLFQDFNFEEEEINHSKQYLHFFIKLFSETHKSITVSYKS
ncbi:MAG: hypothetical protein IGQ45_09080 [Cyanobacterium sp. T60_A2020_053]|nr:hypothetical protein [Cyanobacterium sp. T60_A2020_053]